jgi:hypothetical protein
MSAPQTPTGATPTTWRIIALYDGSPWLTDGVDFGIAPDDVPALLVQVAALKAAMDEAVHRLDCGHTDVATRLRAALVRNENGDVVPSYYIADNGQPDPL